jgi:hypothetical protein
MIIYKQEIPQASKEEKSQKTSRKISSIALYLFAYSDKS